MDLAWWEIDLHYLVCRVYIGIYVGPLLFHYVLELIYTPVGMTVLVLHFYCLQQLHVLVSHQQSIASITADQMSIVMSETPTHVLPLEPVLLNKHPINFLEPKHNIIFPGEYIDKIVLWKPDSPLKKQILSLIHLGPINLLHLPLNASRVLQYIKVRLSP